MPTALITGVAGQDGSYLADLLLGKGHEFHGVIRRSSSVDACRMGHIYQNSHESGVRTKSQDRDLADGSRLARLIRTVEQDEIDNLAAQSNVPVSFQQPGGTGDVDGRGAVRLLEAIRAVDVDTKLYQASTSEKFANDRPPQDVRPSGCVTASPGTCRWYLENVAAPAGR